MDLGESDRLDHGHGVGVSVCRCWCSAGVGKSQGRQSGDDQLDQLHFVRCALCSFMIAFPGTEIVIKWPTRMRAKRAVVDRVDIYKTDLG